MYPSSRLFETYHQQNTREFLERSISTKQRKVIVARLLCPAISIESHILDLNGLKAEFLSKAFTSTPASS